MRSSCGRLLVLSLAVAAATARAQVIHVDAGAAGAGDGTSWTDAYTDLQDALAEVGATTKREVWVAAGVYQPHASTRSVAFDLDRTNLKLYGGFAGTETLLSERDVEANPTILSGDLLGNDGPDFANRTDNSYHVVVATGSITGLVLDGFTITSGFANFSDSNQNHGGGLIVFASAGISVANCRFESNHATESGAAVFCFQSVTRFENCVFAANGADGAPVLRTSIGGGIRYFAAGGANSKIIDACSFFENYAGSGGGGAVGGDTSGLRLTNSVFTGNVAGSIGGVGRGGALALNAGSPNIVNCLIAGNTCSGRGGAGIALTTGTVTPTISNTILWGNLDNTTADELAQIVVGTAPTPLIQFSIVQGLTTAFGPGNLDADPLLVDLDGADNVVGTDDDDLRLQSGSPAVEAGDQTLIPAGITLDRDGADRVQCDEVDIGAYESPFGSGGGLTIDCPADVTLECPASTAPAFTGEATATGCGAIIVSHADAVTAGCGGTSTIERTWTADDGFSTASCVQTIVTEDTQPPALAGVPADETVECDAIPAAPAVSASDACDPAPGVSFSEDASGLDDCDGTGTLVRTWTATDACGNNVSASQTITVVDTTPPVIDLGGATTITVTDVDCDNEEDATLPGATVSDNCDPSVTVETSPVGPYPAGETTTVTFTATDACGNSSSESVDVEVKYGAAILVDLDLMIVGLGHHPGVTNEPIEGATVKVFGRPDTEHCSHHPGWWHGWHWWRHVHDGCSESPFTATALTDANGQALIDVPPGDYVVIAKVDFDNDGDFDEFVGGKARDVDCGETQLTRLRIIRTHRGKHLPCNIWWFTGSDLLVAEPDTMIWDQPEQEYPFGFESVGAWDVTVSVTPPEGFVSDVDLLSDEVNDEIESLQFTVTEVGSDLVPTQTAMDIMHKGRLIKVRSDVGILLTPDYARSRGFDVRELRARGLIVERAPRKTPARP